jgi:hypothetical protein
MRMHHFVICCLLGSIIFSHYLINGTIFEKKKITVHNTCFDYLLSETFLLRRTEHDIIKSVQWSISSDFNAT